MCLFCELCGIKKILSPVAILPCSSSVFEIKASASPAFYKILASSFALFMKYWAYELQLLAWFGASTVLGVDTIAARGCSVMCIKYHCHWKYCASLALGAGQSISGFSPSWPYASVSCCLLAFRGGAVWTIALGTKVSLMLVNLPICLDSINLVKSLCVLKGGTCWLC